jgi:hypothetical protein
MNISSAVQKQISLSSNINNIGYFDYSTKSLEKTSLSKILDIDYWSFITHPPLNNSKITTSDLTEVLRLANNRTKSDELLVLSVDEDPINLFDPLIQRHNLIFSHEQLHNLYVFLGKIITDVKDYFNRPRPFQLAEFYGQSIEVIHTKTHHTPSYPSGHTAYAALIAMIIESDYPQYSSELWNIVQLCGQARIMQGVHFAGDNTASINLVKKVYPSLVRLNKLFT